MLPSERIKRNNGSKRIIWRQQHDEAQTSGQQKHWRELFHSIPQRSSAIVGRKKGTFVAQLLIIVLPHNEKDAVIKERMQD